MTWICHPLKPVCCFICRFIYETEHFNGVGELLEILGRYNYVFFINVEKDEKFKKIPAY